MARHEYISFKLINPMITSWNHNKLDYSDVKVNNFDMKIKCEAIAYHSGNVGSDIPEGFAMEHYDNMHSPLTGEPNTTSASPKFDNKINSKEVISAAYQQINTYQNTKT